jgi:malate/lactate dehydrogenase
VAIVGAERVGTTLAYTCLVRGVGKSIALYGRDPERVRAEVLDLHHGLQFVPTATVIGSADLEVCRGADVVAVTASAPMVPGRSRLDLAEANVAICRELVPRLVEVAPSAIFLFVTNPVDVVTYAALRISGLPGHRSSAPEPCWTARGCDSSWPGTAAWPCRTCTPTSSASTATPRCAVEFGNDRRRAAVVVEER